MSRWAAILSCCALAWIWAGCEGDKPAGGDDRIATILSLTGDPAAGQGIYDSYCTTCHGADAKGGVGPDLTVIEDPEQLVTVILEGKGSMTAYDSLLDQDIANCLAYIESL